MSKRKKIILITIAAVLVLLLLWALWPSPVPVSTVEVRRGYFAEFVDEEGRTWLRDTWTVSAPIGGLVRRVDLEPGDPVDAGQMLFVMEATPAPALDARAREQAREALAAAGARLRSAEAELETRQAEAAFASAEYRRLEQVFERGLVSATERDHARSQHERARAAVRAAREVVEVVRFEMESARAVLEISQGQRAGDDQPLLQVRGPAQGVVLRRHRDSEAVIAAGEPVIEIGNLDQLEVRVDLLSMDAVRVRPGMRVILERWGGTGDLEGRVRRVEPAGFLRVSALGVDEQRVPVLIELLSPREQWMDLGDGYRVEARFILWEGDDVLQVPTSALFREDGQWRVFVVDNGRARQRAVQPGRRSGLMTQIVEGLSAGETIITHPGAHIEAGSRVAADRRD